MNVNRSLSRAAALVIVGALLALPAKADDFTWQAGTTDVSDAANWTPAGGPPGGTATQVHNAHFGAAGSTTPTQGDVNYWVKQMFFDAGAQAYTYTGTSGALTYLSIFPVSPANGMTALSNDSSQQQVLNVTTGKTGIGGVINTGTAAGGALVINTPLLVSDGSSNGGNYLGLAGSNNIYFNVDTSINAAGDINGGTWTNSSTSSMYRRARARFSMANFSGTAFLGNIGTSYTGTFHLNSTVNGALRLTHDNSLGAPGTSSNGVQIYGGTTGNATLEIVGGITVTRGVFFLDGRSGPVADDPHILNVSGNNTINVTGDWDTGIHSPITTNSDTTIATANAGNWNLQSDSGKLTIVGGNFYNTANVATTVQLKGAGDGQFDAPWLTYLANPTFNVVKSGTGTWTYNNGTTVPPVDSGLFSGTVDIQQGTFSLGASGTLPSASSISVNSGATFDVSGLFGGEYTLGATTTLKGAGTVTGGIVTNAGSAIAPGNSVGTLTLSGGASNLTLGGGTLQYELTNNPAGANDKIVVGGDLTLGFGGPTTIAVTALNNALGNGSYRLIDYAGTLTDFGSGFTLTGVGGATTRQTFAVDTSTAQQVNLNVTGTAASLTWVGGNNSNAWDLVTTVNWTGAPGPAFDNRFYDGDSVTFTDSGSNSPNINVVGTLSPAVVTFSNTSAHNYTLGGTGDINVAGNFTSTSSGDVTVANAGFSVGGSLVQNGSGKVTLANSGGALSVPTIALNSGTLALNRTDDFALTGAISGGGTLRKEGANTATVSGNNSAFTGPITVAAGTLRSDGNNALGTAAGVVTVEDGATLDIWNNGPIAPGAGIKAVSITGTGVGGIGALVTTQASAVSAAHVNQLILTGDSKIAAIGSGVANSYLWVDGPGASVQGNGHNLSVVVDNGLTTGGTEIDWINAGNANLNNVNISGGGAFYLGGDTTLGSAGTLTLENQGRLGIYGSLSGAVASTAVIDKPIVVDNTANGGGIEVWRGSNTFDSPITMNGNLDVTAFNSNSNTTSIETFTGKLTGAGALTVHLNAGSTVSRLGRVELTNDDNDFTGPTTIGGGGGMTGANAANDRISLAIGNGGSTGSIGPGDITLHDAASRVFLYFNRTGAYTVPNTISGTGSVASLAPGVVTLSGANSYAGTTDVNAGTLLVNGTHTGGGQYTVASGATLGGAGTIDSEIVVADGGTLAPGASVGTLSVNNNVSLDGTLSIEVSGTNIDLLAATGSLTLGGASVLDIQGNLATAVTHVIASYSPGTLVGTFADALDATTNGYNVVYENSQIILDELDGDANHDGIVDIFDINLVSSNWSPAGPVGAFAPGNVNHDSVVDIFDVNMISFNWFHTTTNGGPAHAQAVPEPSTLVIALLGLVGIVGFRRYNRRREI